MDDKIYLECINSKSNKFYELILKGSKVYINYGRINKSGKKFTKKFNDENAAAKFFQKQTIKKFKKGYKKSYKKNIKNVLQLNIFSEFEIQSFLYTEDEYRKLKKID